MPLDPTSTLLRYDPERLPELRQAFARAIAALRPKMEELSHKGRLGEPWMNDPVSHRVRDFYNEIVMDSPAGGYHSLRAYEMELQRVHDALLAAERNYADAEARTLTRIRETT